MNSFRFHLTLSVAPIAFLIYSAVTPCIRYRIGRLQQPVRTGVSVVFLHHVTLNGQAAIVQRFVPLERAALLMHVRDFQRAFRLAWLVWK